MFIRLILSYIARENIWFAQIRLKEFSSHLHFHIL